MMRRAVLALAAGVLLYGSARAQVPAGGSPVLATARDCGDFLAAMGKKPRHLRFVECAYQPERQGKPLSATYRTTGRHAAAIEEFLVAAFGMERLRRSCCQWDGPERQFRAADGRDYSVRMVSEQSVFGTRAEWDRIALFEVVIETLTEEI